MKVVDDLETGACRRRLRDDFTVTLVVYGLMVSRQV
jgi:hypothetical protein